MPWGSTASSGCEKQLRSAHVVELHKRITMEQSDVQDVPELPEIFSELRHLDTCSAAVVRRWWVWLCAVCMLQDDLLRTAHIKECYKDLLQDWRQAHVEASNFTELGHMLNKFRLALLPLTS